MRYRLLAALVFVFMPTIGAALPAWAGTIHGAVTLTGAPPAPRKLPVTIDQYVCGESKDAEDLQLSSKQGVRNVVAWIENPPGENASPRSAAAPPPATGAGPAVDMDQRGCVFTPRVVLLPAGGTVNFLNSDRLLHNLHGRPKSNAPFNRTQPKGRTIPLAFAQPEIFSVDCDLHSWMKAWVVVAEHPYYALSDAEGRFTLDGLPPGRYKVRLWHETLGSLTREVEVPSSGRADLAVQMSLPKPR
jgi:plastocyanin